MRVFFLTVAALLCFTRSSSADFVAHPEALSVFAGKKEVPRNLFPKSWTKDNAVLEWLSTARKSLEQGDITWIPEELLGGIGVAVTAAESVLDEMERTVRELENLEGVNKLITDSRVQLPQKSVICDSFWHGDLFREICVASTYCIQTKKYGDATRWLDFGNRVNRLYACVATDREIFYQYCLIQRALFAIQCELFQHEQASHLVCKVTYPRLPDNQRFLLEIARLQLGVERRSAVSRSNLKLITKIDAAERILTELQGGGTENDIAFLKTFRQRLVVAQRDGESGYLPLINEMMELRRSFNLVCETQGLLCKVAKLQSLEAVKEMVTAHSTDDGLLHAGFRARVIIENGVAFLETQVDPVSSEPQPLSYPTRNQLKGRWRVCILK